MRDVYDKIQAIGAEVLVITMSRPEVLTRFLEQIPFPFPLVCDPELRTYRQFELPRTSWLSFFRPSVLFQYLRLIGRGGKVRETNEGDRGRTSADRSGDQGRRCAGLPAIPVPDHDSFHDSLGGNWR